MKLIVYTQGIEDYKKMKNTDLEPQIIKSRKTALFIDDIQRATPKLIHFLTAKEDMGGRSAGVPEVRRGDEDNQLYNRGIGNPGDRMSPQILRPH